MALGELPLLRRHIERCLNMGMAPEQVVEVFIQLTFYVGVPATEALMMKTATPLPSLQNVVPTLALV